MRRTQKSWEERRRVEKNAENWEEHRKVEKNVEELRRTQKSWEEHRRVGKNTEELRRTQKSWEERRRVEKIDLDNDEYVEWVVLMSKVALRMYKLIIYLYHRWKIIEKIREFIFRLYTKSGAWLILNNNC